LAPPLILPASEQVWRGVDVTLAEVLGQLNQLRAAAARQEIADQEHIHPRNSVLDVIVISSDPAEAERAAAVVEELAIHHPCRAVVVLDEPGAGKSRIDATVTSLTHPLVAGAACQYEQVFLRVRGQAAEHISSLVDSLLIPDVLTYLWWTGSPPIGKPRFASTFDSADVLLVDSARFERPFESFAALAELAAGSSRTAFGDFHWTRMAPWREVLAQFFNPPARRGFLRGIGALGIDYVADGRGNRSAAVLLAGWLGSALGWKLEGAAAGKGGGVVAVNLRSSDGHPVEVAMRPVEMEGFQPGEITAVKIDAVNQGRTCLLHATRDGEDTGHVMVDAAVGGSQVPRLVLPVPARADAELLSRLLIEARGDRAYRGALQMGAGMLKSARG
jgi:glucose-6-phosphate dehydrogenase assembly protein OpcA